MIADEAVESAAREARKVLAERGRSGFNGSVEVKYQNDEITLIRVEETFKKQR